MKQYDISIVMPCLNEEKTIGTCINKIKRSFKNTKYRYEIIVADNGSTDESVSIAKKLGAIVVNVSKKGYGSALTGGIQMARGKFVIMGDSDDSYDFSKLKPFFAKYNEGYEFVIGNRFAGKILPGAMPVLHRKIGNPLFSFMGRLFFRSKVGDFYCGLRGFTKALWKKMALQATGMEYAIEMVIKATLLNAKIDEIPITLHKDGRMRKPHLKTWQDGWRTLRFILLFAPSWLFLTPGVLSIFLGMILFFLALPGSVSVYGIRPDVHTMLVSSALIIVGMQISLFGVFTKLLIEKLRLLPAVKKDLTIRLNPAKIFLASVLFLFLGFIILGSVIVMWYLEGFGRLDYSSTMRIVIPSVLFILIGVQLIFNAFFLDILMLPGVKNKRR